VRANPVPTIPIPTADFFIEAPLVRTAFLILDVVLDRYGLW